MPSLELVDQVDRLREGARLVGQDFIGVLLVCLERAVGRLSLGLGRLDLSLESLHLRRQVFDGLLGGGCGWLLAWRCSSGFLLSSSSLSKI